MPPCSSTSLYPGNRISGKVQESTGGDGSHPGGALGVNKGG